MNRGTARCISLGGRQGDTGLWDPNLERWCGTREGREAAEDFGYVVNRDMNRTPYWPGGGTEPLLYDKWWGKVFGQLQTFMFAFTHAYLQPMMQRAVHFQDMQAASSFTALMVTGDHPGLQEYTAG